MPIDEILIDIWFLCIIVSKWIKMCYSTIIMVYFKQKIMFVYCEEPDQCYNENQLYTTLLPIFTFYFILKWMKILDLQLVFLPRTIEIFSHV